MEPVGWFEWAVCCEAVAVESDAVFFQCAACFACAWGEAAFNECLCDCEVIACCGGGFEGVTLAGRHGPR